MNLYDVIILAVLAAFALIGARKGLIMTLCGLVAAILALTGARLAADNLSPSIAYLIEPSIRDVVYTEMDSALPETAEELEDFDWAYDDGGLLEQLVTSDFYQHFLQTVQESVHREAHQAAETASTVVAESLAQTVAWFMTYVVAFFLILVLGTLLGHGLDLAAKLPGLRLVNQSLGGLCGLIQGIVIVTVVCSLSVGFGLFPDEAMENSSLLALFSAFSTISL